MDGHLPASQGQLTTNRISGRESVRTTVYLDIGNSQFCRFKVLLLSFLIAVEISAFP